jgi:hypothetical protein
VRLDGLRWELHCYRGTSENWTKHVALFTDYLPDDIKDVVTIHMSKHVTSIVIPPRDSTDSRWELRRCRGTSENWTKYVTLFTEYLLDDIKVTSIIHTSNYVTSIVILSQHSMDSKWELRHWGGVSVKLDQTHIPGPLFAEYLPDHINWWTLLWEQCPMRVCEWHLNGKISNIRRIRVIQFF